MAIISYPSSDKSPHEDFGCFVQRDNGSDYKNFPPGQDELAKEYYRKLQVLDNQEKLIKLQQENLKLQHKKRANTDSTISDFNRNFKPKPLLTGIDLEREIKREEIREKQRLEQKKENEQFRQNEQLKKDEIISSSNPQQLRTLYEKYKRSRICNDRSYNLFMQNSYTPSDVLEKILKEEYEIWKYGHYTKVFSHKNAPFDYINNYLNWSSFPAPHGSMYSTIYSYEKGIFRILIDNPNTPIEIKNIITKKLEQKSKQEYKENTTWDERNCYIATACYGSYDCKQVLTFRNFRDKYLVKILAGRMFVKTYYAISPKVAEWLKSKHKVNLFVRSNFLDRIYNCLKKKY